MKQISCHCEEYHSDSARAGTQERRGISFSTFVIPIERGTNDEESQKVPRETIVKYRYRFNN